MVRVKHRYLVINFLYPLPPTTSKSSDPAPELLQFHAPTPDAFHVGLLLRVIRDGVTELFGEYGMGIVGRGLKSKTLDVSNLQRTTQLMLSSQLLVSLHLYSHSALSARPL